MATYACAMAGMRQDSPPLPDEQVSVTPRHKLILDMMNRRAFFLGLTASTSLVSLALPVRAASPAVEAVARALAGDYTTAGSLAAQSGESAAVKFVELLYLRDKALEAGYSRIMAFLAVAPDWPLHETIRKRAEQALFEGKLGPDVVAKHFADDPEPLTPYGAFALARAAFATGDQAKGHHNLRKGWSDSDTDQHLEALVQSEFGQRLTRDDHILRFASLLYAQDGEGAVRHAGKYLGHSEQSLAKTANALLHGDPSGERLYLALPEDIRHQLPLLYVMARWYRRHDMFDKARNILLAIPNDANAMHDPEAWFDERKVIVRRSLGPNQKDHWKAAYTIAVAHGLKDGSAAIEAEFLSGFVALRYLNSPEMALGHFHKLQNLATNGTETARALYWLGRTQTALNKQGEAKALFTAAAKHTSVYYGQLAREQVGLGHKPEEILPASNTEAAMADVEKDEMVRALHLLAQAGTKNQLVIFLAPLAARFKDADHLNATAKLFEQLGGTTMSVRFAKASEMNGHDLDSWSYPLRGLPEWTHVGKPIERPLVYALSRQESEFNPDAGSGAGAQGLMQMMPGTANLVARQYGIGWSPGKLKDPVYNVRLGAAHLADLVAQNGGSYVLTLIAYNAGPKRAREWAEYFGDPRSPNVDAIDWVETIPFNETRQYVQKVLQNLHIYRSRLAPSTVRPMTADLRRGGVADGINTGSIAPASQCKTGSGISIMANCT